MSIDQRGVDRLRAEVLENKLNRRDVLKRSLALGLTAPAIATLLAACGGDDDDDSDATEAAEETEASSGQDEAETEEAVETEAAAEGTEAEMTEAESTEAESTESESTEAATEGAETEESSDAEEPAGERGGMGDLLLLYWQAPTILNIHLSQGTKDDHASRVCLEPLVDFDSDANPILYLAEEYPSVENGTLAEDGTWVTWKLRKGVKWHDGEDFTAEDVKFTWEYASNPDTTATTIDSYSNIESVDIIDDHTVRLNFFGPTPNWFDSFGGPLVLPEHVLRDYVGAKAADAPFNLMPIGTGPYKVVQFNPGDVVVYELFEDYWDPGKPHFDRVQMKGGGDATSAARAVLVTGEADWAWNLQVEPKVLNQLAEEGGDTGELVAVPGVSAERIMINFADPHTEVDGAFSEPSTEHPIWKFKEAREAINLAAQRQVITDQLYGTGSEATGDSLNVPPRFKQDWPWEYNLDKAKEKLAAINFPDDFESNEIVYQTSINTVRQKTQEIIKSDLEELGFAVSLKTVDSSVFFSSDAGNPDTTGHFYADLEMYTNGPGSPYPIAWASRFRADQIASQANQWRGSNISRWNNPKYDELHDKAQVTIDQDEQNEIWAEMLGLAYEDIVEVPLVWRGAAAAVNSRIQNWTPSTWASTPVYDLKNWTTEDVR